MSTLIVERIKQIADCIINESVSPLVKHAETIEQVSMFFADFESKAAYQKELLFLGFLPIFGLEKSAMLAGNFQNNANNWQKAVAKQNELAQEKAIPNLLTNFAPQSPEIAHLNTINFVLEEFSNGSVQIKEKNVVLDIGAGFGHTAFWAKSKNPKQVFSFEANPILFEYLEKNTDDTDNIYAYNLLFANQKGKLNYTIQRGDTREVVEVDVTTLDNWCKDLHCKPDFIKISADNAQQCLIGGQTVIQKNKPQLAIVLGKHLNDMWEIPLLVKSIVPGYKFYCKKNAPYGDFILYASTEKNN